MKTAENAGIFTVVNLKAIDPTMGRGGDAVNEDRKENEEEKRSEIVNGIKTDPESKGMNRRNGAINWSGFNVRDRRCDDAMKGRTALRAPSGRSTNRVPNEVVVMQAPPPPDSDGDESDSMPPPPPSYDHRQKTLK